MIDRDLSRLFRDQETDKNTVEDMWSVMGAAIRGQFKTLAPAAKQMSRAGEKVADYISKMKKYVEDEDIKYNEDVNGLDQDTKDLKGDMLADIDKEREVSKKFATDKFDKKKETAESRWEDLAKTSEQQYQKMMSIAGYDVSEPP